MAHNNRPFRMTDLRRGAAGAALAIFFGLFCFVLGPGQALIRWSYDWSIALRPDVVLTNCPAIIIYMNDESHQALEQELFKPWNRDVHAELIEKLTAWGAKV